MTSPKATPLKPEKIRVLDIDAVAPEIFAQAIIDIADSARRLLDSRLTKRAIYVLIRDLSGVSLSEIKAVLDAAADLKKTYIRG